MYKKQIEHLLSRFEESKKAIRNNTRLERLLKSKGKTKTDFCQDFEEDTQDLRDIASFMATQVSNQHPTCYTYAAAIAVIAEELGYEYKVFAGMAVNMETDQKIYDKVKNHKFTEHEPPFTANYIFIRTDEKDYGYLNGFDTIEYIYVTEQE